MLAALPSPLLASRPGRPGGRRRRCDRDPSGAGPTRSCRRLSMSLTPRRSVARNPSRTCPKHLSGSPAWSRAIARTMRKTCRSRSAVSVRVRPSASAASACTTMTSPPPRRTARARFRISRWRSAKRIEVLRGPFSALYGNASGGVINVYTADAPATPLLKTGVVFGSDGLLPAIGRLARPWGARREGDILFDAEDARDGGYRAHSASRRDASQPLVRGDTAGDGRFTLLANALDLQARRSTGTDCDPAARGSSCRQRRGARIRYAQECSPATTRRAHPSNPSAKSIPWY